LSLSGNGVDGVNGPAVQARRESGDRSARADPEVAADWQRLSEIRREAFRALLSRIPAAALRPGLTPAAAADTAWAIASPDTHHQLVREAGYSYDELEDWTRATLSAALFPDR